MLIDKTLQTPNSRWHTAHNIRRAVASMTEQEKAHCLEKIQANITLNEKPPDLTILKYTSDLLNGKEPRNGISRRI